MISDEQLQAFKELMESTNETEPQSDLRYQNFFYMAIVEELQQHRAAQHERRWRKISEEGLPVCLDYIQISNIHDGWKFSYDKNVPSCYHGWVKNNATHWRPQPTDLPEGE